MSNWSKKPKVQPAPIPSRYASVSTKQNRLSPSFMFRTRTNFCFASLPSATPIWFKRLSISDLVCRFGGIFPHRTRRGAPCREQIGQATAGQLSSPCNYGVKQQIGICNRKSGCCSWYWFMLMAARRVEQNCTNSFACTPTYILTRLNTICMYVSLCWWQTDHAITCNSTLLKTKVTSLVPTTGYRHHSTYMQAAISKEILEDKQHMEKVAK